MSDYKNDPPTIIEHTTVNPVVERNTIIERTSWYSEPWMVALLIGAIAVIGLISYWAIYNPASPPPVVNNTTIERDAPDHRAQTLAQPSVMPPVVVNPPASSSPTINVNPAPTTINNNPVPSGSTTQGGSSDSSPSNGYPNGAATPGDGSGNNGVAPSGTGSGSTGSGGD